MEKIEDGNLTSAEGKIGAFINKINSLINNKTITPEQGQQLIDLANQILN